MGRSVNEIKRGGRYPLDRDRAELSRPGPGRPPLGNQHEGKVSEEVVLSRILVMSERRNTATWISGERKL